jgi:FkbM family methyltransferase
VGIKRIVAEAFGSALVGLARLPGQQFFSYAINRFMGNSAAMRHIATRTGDITFWSGNEICGWRAETLLTKEPETIEWIDSFDEGDVYWDIGANVGVYALYAAKRSDIRVLAFEPSPFNYYALCRNVELNRLGESLSAYCLAFNDATVLDYFNMSTVEIGGALSSFGETTDYWGKQFNPQFRQAMIGFSVDDFIARFNPSFPTHLKIDVDGIEEKIVEGGLKTLADHRLKSVSIELDINRANEEARVTQLLTECGLVLRQRKHSYLIADSEFASSYNYLFVRGE